MGFPWSFGILHEICKRVSGSGLSALASDTLTLDPQLGRSDGAAYGILTLALTLSSELRASSHKRMAMNKIAQGAKAMTTV